MQDFKELINGLHCYSLANLKEINPSSKKNLEIDNGFKEIFHEIATHLMGKLCINIAGKHHTITECEIYYNDSESHQDPYPYGAAKSNCSLTEYQKECAKQQVKKLHWFFHYSGLDITIGDDKKIIGGILIRSMQNVSGGPSKLCMNILNDVFGSVFSLQNAQLFLEKYDCEERLDDIILSKRKGLDRGKELTESNSLGNKSDLIFYERAYNYSIK